MFSALTNLYGKCTSVTWSFKYKDETFVYETSKKKIFCIQKTKLNHIQNQTSILGSILVFHLNNFQIYAYSEEIIYNW